MAVKENKDCLYLIWKSEKNRTQYIIGELSKNTQYEFKYGTEISKAQDAGFMPLISFPELDTTYRSDVLFPVFESRLPDKKRRDMDSILNKYGLKEYEPYQLLKRSGARLPIDSLYFIDPIFETNKPFKRVFYMAGVRHYIGCDGSNCDKTLEIETGDEVILKLEPTNSMDNKAIQVLNRDHQLLGYIPRYYSSSIFDLIKNNRKITCTVLNVDKNKRCDECIKLTLEVD